MHSKAWWLSNYLLLLHNLEIFCFLPTFPHTNLYLLSCSPRKLLYTVLINLIEHLVLFLDPQDRLSKGLVLRLNLPPMNMLAVNVCITWSHILVRPTTAGLLNSSRIRT